MDFIYYAKKAKENKADHEIYAKKSAIELALEKKI